MFKDLAGTHTALPSVLGSPDRWLPFQQRLSTHQAAAACQLPEELQPPSFRQEASERLNGAVINVSEVLSALHTLHNNGRASGPLNCPRNTFVMPWAGRSTIMQTLMCEGLTSSVLHLPPCFQRLLPRALFRMHGPPQR